MLRKIRLTFAMICFALITLLFLDFTGTLYGWFGWLAKIQFLPAVLALNVGVILFLVILTLVCGRIYCSVICPLGVFQDILAWLGRQPKKRRKLPYSYSPALSWLRYGVLGVFIIALIAGIGSLAALLAPYNTALMISEEYPKGHPQVVQPAIQQARNLIRNLQRAETGLPLQPFIYQNKGSMATIGRNHAVVELKKLRFGGFPAWAVWLFIHLMSIVGVKNRLFIFVDWMWSYFTYDPSLRIIIKPLKRE